MALALFASSFAANRVGPVSQYGQLQAGKDANGKGRIFGSCSAYNSNPLQSELFHIREYGEGVPCEQSVHVSCLRIANSFF